MKTLATVVAITILLPLPMLAEKTNSLKMIDNHVFSGDSDFGANTGTNLVSFFSNVELVNVDQMIKTNGLECWAAILSPSIAHNVNRSLRSPVCWVYIHNHSTNYIGCLRMPASYLCRIALLDQQGHEVKKTNLGKTYGQALSQGQIDKWLRNWNNHHQLPYIRIYAGGDPKVSDLRTDICFFSLKDVFEIKNTGEYVLHAQMRIIQAGQDSSGKLHYPVTWLPEVVTKVQIYPEDIPQNNPPRSTQTNAFVK
jgi:hypothetical protein